MRDMRKWMNSDYISAMDLMNDDGDGYRNLDLTIGRVNDPKPVKLGPKWEELSTLTFRDSAKGMILRNVHMKSLVKLFGPNADLMTGRKVRLWVEKDVKAFGDIMDCVRFRRCPSETLAAEDLPEVPPEGGGYKQAPPPAGDPPAPLAHRQTIFDLVAELDPDGSKDRGAALKAECKDRFGVTLGKCRPEQADALTKWLVELDLSERIAAVDFDNLAEDPPAAFDPGPVDHAADEVAGAHFIGIIDGEDYEAARQDLNDLAERQAQKRFKVGLHKLDADQIAVIAKAVADIGPRELDQTYPKPDATAVDGDQLPLDGEVIDV